MRNSLLWKRFRLTAARRSYRLREWCRKPHRYHSRKSCCCRGQRTLVPPLHLWSHSATAAGPRSTPKRRVSAFCRRHRQPAAEAPNGSRADRHCAKVAAILPVELNRTTGLANEGSRRWLAAAVLPNVRNDYTPQQAKPLPSLPEPSEPRLSGAPDGFGGAILECDEESSHLGQPRAVPGLRHVVVRRPATRATS